MNKIISDLAARAFRRPLSAGEAQPFVTIAESAQRRSGSSPYAFEHGVSVGLRAILVSPDFLFRMEKSPVSGAAPQRISNYELASRLS